MSRVASMLAVPMLVLAIACGGGDDSSADSGGPSTTPSASATPAGGPSSGDFCAPDNVEVIFDGLDFSGVDDVEEQIALMNPALDQLVGSAPDEIKADVDAIVNVMRGLFQLFEEYDFDAGRVITDGADDPRFTVLQSESYGAAAARLADFCGFDIDGGS